MFNKFLLALGLMILSGTVLSAPPSASLRVSGSVTSPSCTLNGQEEDSYTYRFNISPDIFPVSGELRLPPQVQRIEVVCDATTYLTFHSTDERAGTELFEGANNYGLGTYATDTRIGYYIVRMDNATVKTNPDASVTQVLVSRGSYYGEASAVIKGTNTGWGVNPGKPAAAQVFAADFTVTPTINGTMKNSTGDVQLDGLMVLTFTFGL